MAAEILTIHVNENILLCESRSSSFMRLNILFNEDYLLTTP